MNKQINCTERALSGLIRVLSGLERARSGLQCSHRLRLGRLAGPLLAFMLSLAVMACTSTNQFVGQSVALESAELMPKVPSPQPFPPLDLFITPTNTVTGLPAVEPEPQVITDFWFHLRKDMHLDLHLDERRVQQELAWLKRHPDYLKRLRDRLQTYLPYIYREVVLKDFPAELTLLPIVESALDLYAFSHGGAAGPWQFIRGTARNYGLTIDEWYDGRRDIVASTDAALAYLDFLHKRYDDWFLALAGYNAGQGNVDRARRRDPGMGFFDLRLPRETQAYVPRLLALVAIIKEPAKYGIELPELENEISFVKLSTHGQFQIDKLVSATGLEQETFRKWNPAFARWATSPRGPHHIVVPTMVDIQRAQEEIDNIAPKARLDWLEVVIRSGDTLSTLAQQHGTDVLSLKRANNLRNTNLRAGKKLLIPAAGKTHATPPRQNTEHASHTVKNGESLWTISRKYKVNLRKLMIANHVGPKDPLSVGRVLTLPGLTETAKIVRTVRYKVRRGDSLDRIANKFNVSITEIVRWNSLDAKKYLQPGQGLVLHVNVVGS
jgi:membrane-bound lytic murein transglycosylase D